jgi:enamine deaminase RidA (YjgF/YER057c/UK114 family)
MNSPPNSGTTLLRPAGLIDSPAFSHVAVLATDTTLVLVGGQNCVDDGGQLVGDDVATQTARALDNLEVALTSAGATLADVVQWRVSVVGDLDIGPAFIEYQRR